MDYTLLQKTLVVDSYSNSYGIWQTLISRTTYISASEVHILNIYIYGI